MYNVHIIKKREVLEHFSHATSTVRVVVVKVKFYQNHPFASYGVGVVFLFLERFSERNMH